MASVEAGPSAVSGASTASITPAGGGVSPSSAKSYSQSGNPFSTGPDAADYGVTASPRGNQSAVSAVVGVQVRWFNIGWYVAGAAFESWSTTGAPSTTPPSGHTLVDVESFVIN